MEKATVKVKKGEARSLKAGGMWIYDNEIDCITGDVSDGDLSLIHISLFSSLEETVGPDDSNFYKHLNRDINSQPFSEAPGLNQAQPGFIINGKKITYKELKILDEYYQGKKGLIAQKLGISRSTLWRYYKEAGLSG